MAGELAWGGVTITARWHKADEQPADAELVDVVYPFSTGRDLKRLGVAQTDATAVAVSFAEEGWFHNRIVGASEAACEAICNSLQTLRMAGTLGTLTFGSYTYTNMRLRSLRKIGKPFQTREASGVVWQQRFTATFTQYA